MGKVKDWEPLENFLNFALRTAPATHLPVGDPAKAPLTEAEETRPVAPLMVTLTLTVPDFLYRLWQARALPNTRIIPREMSPALRRAGRFEAGRGVFDIMETMASIS